MVEICFVLNNGQERRVQAAEGDSILKVALDNDIQGIVGECGGSCSCATCHVYVESVPANGLELVADVEAEMLEWVVDERREGSRLCCQITVGADWDGAVFRIPARQT